MRLKTVGLSAILAFGMIVILALFVAWFGYVLIFESHTETITIELVNGNQTGTCEYAVTVKGNFVQSGTLQPGEAIVLKTIAHWHGGNSVLVKVSNGIIVLEDRWTNDEPLRFILYPDEIKEVGQIGK